MAQGKLKVKTKAPPNCKSTKSKNAKPFANRANKPIQPKKNTMKKDQKIKQMLTKNLNKAIEAEVRSMTYSSSTNRKLSSTQKAVAQYNKKTVLKKT